MKKLIYSMLALAMTAMTLVSCESVPMPYELPTNNTTEEETVAATGTGTQADPYNVAAALKLIKGLAAGVETDQAIYVKGKVKSLGDNASAIAQYGNANYYITDDNSNELYIFQSYYLGNVRFTSEDQIKVGDEVIIYGKFVNYKGNTPETVGKGTSYIYSLNGQTSGGSSETTEALNTEATAYTVAEAVAKIADGSANAGEAYVKGIISEVTSYNSTYKSITYYISDNGTDKTLQIYSGKGKDGADFAAKTDLKVGQTVVVKGQLKLYTDKSGNSINEMDKSSQIISITGEGVDPTPSTGGETTPVVEGAITAASFGITSGNEWGTQTLSDGTKIIGNAGTNSNAPKYYSTGSGTIRMYPSNSLSFEATKTIESITIVCDSYQGTDYTAEGLATTSAGTIALDGLTYTISGINSNKVVFTNGNTGKGGTSQVRILSFTINYAK